MAIDHSEAIELGRENYIREAVSRDDMFVGDRSLYSDTRIESRLARFQDKY